jgi:hypothetical protein
MRIRHGHPGIMRTRNSPAGYGRPPRIPGSGNHDAADLASMLAGLEPVDPEVCEAHRWVTGEGGEPEGKPVYALAAVGVKSLRT